MPGHKVKKINKPNNTLLPNETLVWKNEVTNKDLKDKSKILSLVKKAHQIFYDNQITIATAMGDFMNLLSLTILKPIFNDTNCDYWEKINKYSNFKASAVVKANAYGFGLEEIAIALTKSGCNFFYVAQIEEGIKLRNCLKSDKIKIGVLEGMIHHPEEYKKNNLIPVINNLNQLNNFINYKKLYPQIRSILHVDTGMNRLGLDKNELDYALDNISYITSVNFEFIMTHFSNSNVQDDNFNNIQYEKILNINSYFKNKKISLSNTGGILLDKKFILDQTRPGIGIYGYDANGKKIILNKSHNLCSLRCVGFIRPTSC